MPIQIAGPLKASEVLSLHDDVVSGLPTFANLKARRVASARKLDSLKGPGIYGLFCKGQLYYVGIYTGASKKTFAGSVLDRWYMHLTYHSLRSPKIRFVASNMLRILRELQGEPSDIFAEMLGGRDLSLDDLRNANVPFIGSGPSCTFNKALFATRNWDVFAPGNEEKMLSEVTFVYARVEDASATLLDGASGFEAYHWAKINWLKSREGALIESLKPICNSETDEFREDVGAEEFMTALRSEFKRPLDRFVKDHPAKMPLLAA